MGVSELKKELKSFEKDKLIELFLDLYKKNKAVKEYFDYFINPDEQALFNKFRDKIYESFYPKRGVNYNLKVGKKAIAEFKKFDPSPILIAELTLFYVETGVEFTIDFGDLGESFYSSMESTFLTALKIMHKERLLDNFAERVENLISRLDENLGWGFEDTMICIQARYY
jgi:hypothetical protein